jgi:Protein of unknown function (DUF1761)
MEINYAAAFVAAIAQFIVGAIWYTPVFGPLWGKIHGFDMVSPEQQKQMMKAMVPMLGVQFLLGLLTSVVLGLFVGSMGGEWHAFGIAGWIWLGFMLPTNVSAVIFGGTAPQWVWAKILISAGGSLACMMAAATVFSLMG